MYCENCGNKLPDGSAFCQECGNKAVFAENGNRREPVDIISFGQYALMIFISGIPFLNIILMIKWALNKQKPNKSNFAKALLFYYLIAVIIWAAYIWLWLKATSSI